MPTDPHLTRRGFIQTTTSAAIAAGIGASIRPRDAAGKPLGANDRIHIGVIGTGGQGTHHIQQLLQRTEAENVRIVQVCDVYRRRLNRSIKLIDGGEAAGTMEYRKVLDNPEVDAVVIATPDHWHTKIAIEAMQAGKDVYVEKPLSHTIEQAIECREAVKHTGRVLQVGPQRTSYDYIPYARKAVADGRMGKVVWSHATSCRNSTEGQFNWPMDPDAGPNAKGDGYVWWDRWLGYQWGLAPKIPWNAQHFFRFRKYYAYNGGVATDLLYHYLAPLLSIIAGPDGEYPKRVVASGGTYIEKDDRDIPDTFVMTVDYPSEHSIVLASCMVNDSNSPMVIYGQYGTMRFINQRGIGSGLFIEEQQVWWERFRKANADMVQTRWKSDARGKKYPRPVPGKAVATFDIEHSRNHMGNFLDAVRGISPLNCNVDLGCTTMVAIKMGVEALRRNRVMNWDADADKTWES